MRKLHTFIGEISVQFGHPTRGPARKRACFCLSLLERIWFNYLMSSFYSVRSHGYRTKLSVGNNTADDIAPLGILRSKDENARDSSRAGVWSGNGRAGSDV
jgi:hypothetical protein